MSAFHQVDEQCDDTGRGRLVRFVRAAMAGGTPISRSVPIDGASVDPTLLRRSDPFRGGLTRSKPDRRQECVTVPSSAYGYGIDSIKRHLITTRNLAELGITEDAVRTILRADGLKYRGQSPDGLSINETTFGEFAHPTAAARGWMAYLNIGSPLIEERADIVQPAPDILSTRSYVNRAENAVRRFDDSVDFAVSNSISWSLDGAAQLTFGGRVGAELQTQLQKNLQHSADKKTGQTNIIQEHPNGVGTEQQSRGDEGTTDTTAYSATGVARGTGELFAQLMLGVTGSISGSLTTSWTSRSSVSGDIPAGNRVETMVTQRRRVTQYTYEMTITFAGYVALHYHDPIPVLESPPQDRDPQNSPTNVIARNISYLGLVRPGETYRPKGIAETVSALEVEHTIFAPERIYPTNEPLSKQRPHYL